MADNERPREDTVAERLIRAREAAVLLGVRPLTIYRWASQGKITSLRIGPGGKLLRFRRADIMALIEERQAQAQPEPDQSEGG